MKARGTSALDPDPDPDLEEVAEKCRCQSLGRYGRRLRQESRAGTGDTSMDDGVFVRSIALASGLTCYVRSDLYSPRPLGCRRLRTTSPDP